MLPWCYTNGWNFYSILYTYTVRYNSETCLYIVNRDVTKIPGWEEVELLLLFVKSGDKVVDLRKKKRKKQGTHTPRAGRRINRKWHTAASARVYGRREEEEEMTTKLHRDQIFRLLDRFTLESLIWTYYFNIDSIGTATAVVYLLWFADSCN